MINATIKVRGLTESALDAIMELIREEAKDVTVDSWGTAESADFRPRHSAQSRITELHQAANITHRHYCGAWQRYGFHEDGIWSAHRLCAEILNRDPWT
jgi:predicted NAD/FAD-binding protein